MQTNSNFHAVLMGFNVFEDRAKLAELSFAEKDAKDLYNLLTDPQYGGYPTKNITLVTGSELRLQLRENQEQSERILSLSHGQIPVSEVRTEDIETILYTQIVKDRTKDDIVLVYYSGHGFVAGKDESAYLATPDVSIFDIQSNPRYGLQMEYLHNDIFMETEAKFVIFILDCCYSGAFCAGLENKERTVQKYLVKSEFYSGEGRVAFVSSPRGVTSRESKDYKNGIFTHHLLNGLKGHASEPSGEVTIASLVSYVQRMAPLSQPPILYGNTTRIVLTKLKTTDSDSTAYAVYPASEIASSHGIQGNIIIESLINPLDTQVLYVDTLLKSIEEVNRENNKSIGNKLLEAIRCSLNAEFVFLMRMELHDSDQNIIYKYESDLNVKGFDLENYKLLVMNDLLASLTRKKKELLPSKYGFCKQFAGMKDAHKYLVVIPLRLEYPREFLILCGINQDHLKYGEVIGRTLISTYNATGELTSLQIKEIESIILDDIKEDFGHVPYDIYKRRFALFKEKLNTISFEFEPIVILRKRRPAIESWEALARDPETKRAPIDLFKTAELWGPQFVTELDIYCLRNAVKKYMALWDEEYPERKFDPLAVNVYPQSLFRSAYKNQLRDIIEQGDISGCLILEISEKRPIPTIETIREHVYGEFDPIDELIDEITKYTSELKIRFAIDDFGVGYSSVSRLTRLELDHIKIDRDILLHTHPECTIEYVKNILKASHSHPTTIIVEGFDGESRISLKDLFDLGIDHIQGHMIRRADSSVSDLSIKERKFIINELRGKQS